MKPAYPLPEHAIRHLAWLHLGENECGGHTRASPGREVKREGLKGWYDFVEDRSRGRSRECLPGFLPECARPLLTLRKNRPRFLSPRGLSDSANNEVLPLATTSLPGAKEYIFER